MRYVNAETGQPFSSSIIRHLNIPLILAIGVLEIEIYIYNILNMKLLHVIKTMPNPEDANAAMASPHR